MSDSYDKIDRFLRNNLDDTDYAEYSAALEDVLAYQRTEQQAGAAMDEAVAAGDGTLHGSFDYWQAEAKRMREAINEALMLLGPEAPECSGCAYEWDHAIKVLSAALAADQKGNATVGTGGKLDQSGGDHA
jgi:hypothetical protein